MGVYRRTARELDNCSRGSRPVNRRRPAIRRCAMIVAGVMSGTSADGINVALVRIQGRGFRSRLELLAHYEFPYPSEVRRAVLHAMSTSARGSPISPASTLRSASSTPTRCERRNGGPSWNVNLWVATGRRSITRESPAVSWPSRHVHLADRRERDHRAALGVPVGLRLPARGHGSRR